ncbi:tRNA 2-thiouridine(34) synthase MnmA [Caldanaerobius polysaccharolyticus]|nr:tRNA 2-thiouridine(34) synthase MnmA [Caldanaerobius polysaccharolyticus]
MAKKVVLGMSGGVDSSVAAYLLQKEGYEVIGVTMQIWPDEDEEKVLHEGGCCSLSAVEDARRVASMLGIPYYVLNFKDIFKEKVIDYFVDEYIHGNTPNPCIACNRFIKFEALLHRARSIGADYVATGHYAKIEYDDGLGRYLLKKAVDQKKDQTYVLYSFTQEQLKHTLMPLGYYTKSQIREIASSLKLPVATKPESQEICFVPDDDYGRFIEEQKPDCVKSGYFVDTKGNVLGRHKGIAHYTIGQRRGLGISAGRPLYVVDIIPEENVVVVGEEEDVYGDELFAKDLNFIPFERLERAMEVNAKIRYTAKEAPATIFPIENDKVKVKFKEPQRAITPGQAVVFYDGDILVGGGIITRNP